MKDLVLFHQQEAIVSLLNRGQPRYLDCSKLAGENALSIEDAEKLGTLLSTLIRDCGFWLGDLARYSEARWPDTHHQVWPTWQSPGQLARNAGVCRSYPASSDRELPATWSQYRQVANQPDRLARLAEMIDQGLTTDEAKKADSSYEREERAAIYEFDAGMDRAEADKLARVNEPRWLLAVDVNLYLHRFFHSGGGVESASAVSSWIERTSTRLKETKGLSHLACCFDARENHRKELTREWNDKYKDRPPKDPEVIRQLTVARELLEKTGFATVSIPGMEADDVMASFAKQFDGNVTLLTQDKDLRQCLSETCNILTDVEWTEDETSGELLAYYLWLTSGMHAAETDIKPEQWCDFQAIMGDKVDGIVGVPGIGKKGAGDLIKKYGTAEAAIEAAKSEEKFILPAKKREALIEFAPKLATTRLLVTLRDDLTLPTPTRL